MKIKADFHIHTHHSSDSSTSASDIVDQAKRVGLDVIGITDHDTTKGALEVRNLAKGKPLVLIGQEVRTLSGEVIVFGPEKDIPRKMNLIDTCKMAKTMGGFIVAPHPFDKTREGVGGEIQAVKEYLDAIEVLNPHCIMEGFNRKAGRFAEDNEIPMVSGSDAHFPGEIGSCFTELEIEGKLTEKSVFDAIVSGRTKIFGKSAGLKPHFKAVMQKLKLV